MFDGLGTELNSIIDNLCLKLGTTVETLIPELCKFKVYESVGYIVALFIISGFIMLSKILLYAHCRKKSFTEEFIFAEGILALILFVLICCIAHHTYNLIVWKNAPTGAAVNYIIQQLKYR